MHRDGRETLMRTEFLGPPEKGANQGYTIEFDQMINCFYHVCKEVIRSDFTLQLAPTPTYNIDRATTTNNTTYAQLQDHRHTGTQDLSKVRPHHKVMPTNPLLRRPQRSLESLSTPLFPQRPQRSSQKISLQQSGQYKLLGAPHKQEMNASMGNTQLARVPRAQE